MNTTKPVEETLAREKTEKPSHIVIITLPTDENITDDLESKAKPLPKPFWSLPEASKWCDEQIKTNPEMQCDIYQLRTELVGEIVIHQKHYNN